MLSFRERFTVVTMTWLTVTGYLCQNWPRICSIFFPHSWRIIVCVTSATRPVPLVEQELLILPEHLCLPPVYSGVRIARTLIFVDRWLFFCPLRCLSFFEIRLLMANFKLFIWVTRVCHIRSGNFLGSLSFFCGVHVAHRFSFLCCGVFLCFVCLHPVSCVPNVASVSGLVFSVVLCFVFCLSSPCVLCAQCCQRLWISFLCCGVFLFFVCLHPLSCVPNVASVSGLVFCVVLCFCVLFVFTLCLVCPMLPASLDLFSVIAPSVFSTFIYCYASLKMCTVVLEFISC
jgi:hypothetical protein